MGIALYKRFPFMIFVYLIGNFPLQGVFLCKGFPCKGFPFTMDSYGTTEWSFTRDHRMADGFTTLGSYVYAVKGAPRSRQEAHRPALTGCRIEPAAG